MGRERAIVEERAIFEVVRGCDFPVHNVIVPSRVSNGILFFLKRNIYII